MKYSGVFKRPWRGQWHVVQGGPHRLSANAPLSNTTRRCRQLHFTLQPDLRPRFWPALATVILSIVGEVGCITHVNIGKRLKSEPRVDYNGKFFKLKCVSRTVLGRSWLSVDYFHVREKRVNLLGAKLSVLPSTLQPRGVVRIRFRTKKIIPS